MNQNERKEPTFGEPEVKNPKTIIPSLRTTQSPGHTFTPVIKPAGSVKSELPKMEGGDAAQPAGFAFAPLREEAVSENAQPEQNIEEAQEKVEEMNEQVKENVEVENKATEAAATEEVKSVAQETVKVAINAAERVIPTAAAATTENNVKEGSSKRRRLGIVALLAAVLGAVFFWLKPSTPETVEELQSQQSGSLPIEFRPVDEAEAQRQEAEAKAQQEAAQQQQAQAQQQAQVAPQEITQPTQEVAAQPQPVQPVANELAQPQPTQAQPVQPQVVPQPVQPQTVTVPAMEKPETQGSVIYQPETKTVQVPQPATPRVEKMRASHHNTKNTEQSKVKAVTKAEFDAKKAQNAQMDRLVKNVEAGKPVATKVEASQTTSAIASSKTLSVPKGVSLMQVFRDNQLNISDVNAMSKVSNKVSNLKVNEKVTVRLDKNNRVVEMTLGSGGKFTRQADGSYRFK